MLNIDLHFFLLSRSTNMMRTHLNVSAGKILTAALCLFQAFALSPPRFGGRPSQPSALTFLRASKAAPSAQPFLEPSVQVRAMKLLLLDAIQNFRNQQAIDGTVSVDFGVKGGELNATSRAPQTVDYYAVSEDLGKAADGVKDVCALLSKENPSDEPTALLGDKINGALAPLNGTWALLFTTAADASFSKDSKRGEAKIRNVVDGVRGTVTNVIEFGVGGEKPPALKRLEVVIRATAASKSRVELQFRYVRAVLNRFFFFPLFGRTLTLYIPVPGPFITRCIVFASRVVKFLKFGRGEVKVPPKAYFDVLYLDKDLRIHKTGEDNLFVQARQTWEEAKVFLA